MFMRLAPCLSFALASVKHCPPPFSGVLLLCHGIYSDVVMRFWSSRDPVSSQEGAGRVLESPVLKN